MATKMITVTSKSLVVAVVSVEGESLGCRLGEPALLVPAQWRHVSPSFDSRLGPTF